MIDPSRTATNNDMSEAFRDGVGVGAKGRVTIKPFGPVGRQDIGLLWSNKTHPSLEQDPSNLLRGLLSERRHVERVLQMDAVEICNNAAITPWLNMAADLQIVDSALDKTLSSSGQVVNKGTAVVGGLRMYVPF